jgi:hypothetical protein
MEAVMTPNVARGVATLFDVCAEALLNEPDERIVSDVQAVASALSDRRFDDVSASPELKRRYYERFFVSSSSWFVALRENNIRMGSYAQGPTFSYGPSEGRLSDHVARCYRVAGFDFHALRGFDPAVGTLHADSLAVECAFVAYLKNAQAVEEENGRSGAHAARMADDFIAMHLLPFSEAAIGLFRQTPDDFYARLCAFVRDCLRAMRT